MKHRLGIACILALLATGPAVQGAFYDATPAWSTGVTDIAIDDGRVIAAHENGLVVALARVDGHIVWSRQPYQTAVTGIAIHEGSAFATFTDPPVLMGLNIADGKEAWRVVQAAIPTAMAADASLVYVGHADGLVTAYAHDGTFRWQHSLAGAVQALTPASPHEQGSRVAFTTASTSGWFDMDGVTAGGPPGLALAWYAGDIVVANGKTLGRYDAGMELLLERLFDYRPTALAADGHLVVGDAAGLVHVLDGDLEDVQPPMATYANAVNTIMVDGDTALVGFSSGWVGIIPLDTRPVALILWPQEQRILPRTIVAKWAYSDPDAAPGDTVTYLVSMRTATEPRGPWQQVATGTIPVAQLTRLAEVHVDVSGFPDGARMEVQLRLTDKQGLVGEDLLGQPFRLDMEPPRARAGTQPAEGGIVTAARPEIGVGHFDAGSGLNEAASRAWIDGSDDVTLRSTTLATTFTPRFDLADGPHTWRLRVEDLAGNWRFFNGTFAVDLAAPTIEGAGVDIRGRDALGLSWRTSEPAVCTVKTAPASQPPASTMQRFYHAVFVTDLVPDTDYSITLRCEDAAGRTAQQTISSRTLARAAQAPQPVLTVDVTPASPDGDAGWYVSVPSLAATTDLAATTIRWSLDGSPFNATPPALAPGRHTVRAVAVSPEGESSALWSRDFSVDLTPPPPQDITWVETLRMLDWEGVSDPESGITHYAVEARQGGDWLTAGSVTWPGSRFEDIPATALQVRVVAVNGAGQTWTSPEFTVGQTTQRTFSTASVPEAVVRSGDFVRVRYHMAHQEQFQTAILRDVNGVEHRFSDQIRLEGRLFEASAPASAFPPGTYQAVVRVTEGAAQRDLAAGPITISADAVVVDDDKTVEPERIDREKTPSPLIPPALLLAVALRRRRR